jgi:hypothetical protein
VWSAFSMPKIWSEKGAKGDAIQGPAPAYKGVFSMTGSYAGNANQIDIVKYNDGTTNKYYMTRVDAGVIPPGTLPTATSKWNAFVGNYENIATGFLFAEKAVIENAIIRSLRTADAGKRVEISESDNTVRIYGDNGLLLEIDDDNVFDYYTLNTGNVGDETGLVKVYGPGMRVGLETSDSSSVGRYGLITVSAYTTGDLEAHGSTKLQALLLEGLLQIKGGVTVQGVVGKTETQNIGGGFGMKFINGIYVGTVPV